MAKQLIFGDLKDRDAKEQTKLKARAQVLELIKLKRGLTEAEETEQVEITAKLDLATSDAVDPLAKAILKDLNLSIKYQEGLLPSQQTPGTPLTEPEKVLTGVFGLLQLDRVTPPPFHPAGVEPTFDPDEDRRKQSFGKAVFTAQGEYQTNKRLFDKVLEILTDVGGAQATTAEVNAVEWASVVRKLIAKGIDENEPQLARRVDDALDSIQRADDEGPPSDIIIDLPSLDDEVTSDNEIVGDNIKALQPAYFSAMFEELKVFQVVDKLVELFQNGVLPIGRGEAGNNLFKYWKETATRMSESERRNFYARSLGIPGGDDNGMPNREFNDLFLRFVSAVSSFIRQNSLDELLQAKIPGSISQQKIRKAARDLAMNLSLHGYGMAYFMATDLQKQIRDAIKVLSDPDIKNAYGARDMWQVIDQVAALELGGARNSVRYRTMAAAGTIILAWLAKNSRELSRSSFGPILNVDEIRNPTPRQPNTKATVDPTDFDLVNACDQWLAVTATQDIDVEAYAQPRESPNMTSRPIQIPDMARETLESVGIPALGYSGNGRKY